MTGPGDRQPTACTHSATGEWPRARVWASCINLKKIQRAKIQTDRMREALGIQARHKATQCEI